MIKALLSLYICMIHINRCWNIIHYYFINFESKPTVFFQVARASSPGSVPNGSSVVEILFQSLMLRPTKPRCGGWPVVSTWLRPSPDISLVFLAFGGCRLTQCGRWGWKMGDQNNVPPLYPPALYRFRHVLVVVEVASGCQIQIGKDA